jgi:hypothetical protein
VRLERRVGSLLNDGDRLRESTDNVYDNPPSKEKEKEKKTKPFLPSSSGWAKLIMSAGKISGTPPTLVDTT